MCSPFLVKCNVICTLARSMNFLQYLGTSRMWFGKKVRNLLGFVLAGIATSISAVVIHYVIKVLNNLSNIYQHIAAYRFHLYLRLLFNSILIHQEIYSHYLTSSSLPFDKCIRVKRADTQKYHLHSCRLAFQRCIICSLIFMQQLSKLYCLQKEKFLQIYIFYLEKIFSVLL